MPPWNYRDFGSLVFLGEYSTVGSLMGSLTRGSLMIEGIFAGLMYRSLYKMHELALHGFEGVRAYSYRPQSTATVLERLMNAKAQDGDRWELGGDARRGQSTGNRQG